MKKALVAGVLVLLFTAGCKKQHVNNAKPVPIAIHEVVNCSAVQAVPVINPRGSEKICVDREAIVTEKNIRQAVPGHNYSNNQPDVMMYLDRAGGTRMYQATERISARYGQVAIFIDGHLVSMPVVKEPIKDSLIIDGQFTEASAQELADMLDANRDRP